MPRACWAGGAAALCLLAVGVGCRVPEFVRLNFLQAPGPGGDRVVVGSLEAVAQSTEASLRALGFSTVLTPEGQDVRIAVTTLRGGTFHLILSRVAGAQGESTRIRMDLQSSPDQEAGTRFLGEFNLHKAEGPPAPPEGPPPPAPPW
jgi:hypothetical protein